MSHSVDKLWAPWRGEWILSQKEKDKVKACPFCELPKEEPNAENLVLFRDDEVCVIMNKFPYNPGHVMVIPREHTGNPAELATETFLKLNAALQIAIQCIESILKPAGMNLGMNIGRAGGAGIPDHMHWHILPRWNGDTNFMPLLAEAKALPFHNVTMYEKLKPGFEGFAEKLAAAMIRV